MKMSKLLSFPQDAPQQPSKKRAPRLPTAAAHGAAPKLDIAASPPPMQPQVSRGSAAARATHSLRRRRSTANSVSARMVALIQTRTRKVRAKK
jgi:hypothetical protein